MPDNKTGNETNAKDIEEYKALTSVLTACYRYGQYARSTILNPKKLKWESLTSEEQKLLPWFPEYLEQLKFSIDVNERFFKDVALKSAPQWGAKPDPNSWFDCSTQDLDKVRGLLIQYLREWSDIGAREREISMGRILHTCERLFPDVNARQHVEVLVPGAGLGRLVVEFVRRGFRTEGNEFSYHMLINSSYILNQSYCSNCFITCPFIHKSSNVVKRNFQNRQAYFPDFNPGDISLINKNYPDIPVSDLMSMVTGSFIDLYGPTNLNKLNQAYTNDPLASKFRKSVKGRFKIIATCFFIDTASNIIDYLKTIKNCLSDDGYWINFGPLLWHHEDDDDVMNTTFIDPVTHKAKKMATPMKGLELSREDLIQLIADMGFTFVTHESDIDSTYGGDDKSLGSWNYKCEFWVCRKVQSSN